MKVEALANFPIERDLVVDMTHFIESLEAIKPYIIGNSRTADQGTNIQTPAQMAKYHQFSGRMNGWSVLRRVPAVWPEPRVHRSGCHYAGASL